MTSDITEKCPVCNCKEAIVDEIIETEDIVKIKLHCFANGKKHSYLIDVDTDNQQWNKYFKPQKIEEVKAKRVKILSKIK